MTKHKQIKSIEELKELANNIHGIEVAILLNGGLKSSKNIRYSEKNRVFTIFNYIDDSIIKIKEVS